MNIQQHFGIYALIFSANNDRLLLITKSRGPYTGLFDMPGGTPELNETWDETLAREVHEETNGGVTSAQYFGNFSEEYKYDDNGKRSLFHHRGVIYIAEISGIPRIDGDGHDSAGCRWYPLADITTKNTSPLTIRALAEYQTRSTK